MPKAVATFAFGPKLRLSLPTPQAPKEHHWDNAGGDPKSHADDAV
jgi:hypothetical protein